MADEGTRRHFSISSYIRDAGRVAAILYFVFLCTRDGGTCVFLLMHGVGRMVDGRRSLWVGSWFPTSPFSEHLFSQLICSHSCFDSCSVKQASERAAFAVHPSNSIVCEMEISIISD